MRPAGALPRRVVFMGGGCSHSTPSLPLMREVDSPQAKTEGEKQVEKILSPSHSLRCASPLVRGGLCIPPARPVVMISKPPLCKGTWQSPSSLQRHCEADKVSRGNQSLIINYQFSIPPVIPSVAEGSVPSCRRDGFPVPPVHHCLCARCTKCTRKIWNTSIDRAFPPFSIAYIGFVKNV